MGIFVKKLVLTVFVNLLIKQITLPIPFLDFEAGLKIPLSFELKWETGNKTQV